MYPQQLRASFTAAGAVDGDVCNPCSCSAFREWYYRVELAALLTLGLAVADQNLSNMQNYVLSVAESRRSGTSAVSTSLASASSKAIPLASAFSRIRSRNRRQVKDS